MPGYRQSRGCPRWKEFQTNGFAFKRQAAARPDQGSGYSTAGVSQGPFANQRMPWPILRGARLQTKPWVSQNRNASGTNRAANRALSMSPPGPTRAGDIRSQSHMAHPMENGCHGSLCSARLHTKPRVPLQIVISLERAAHPNCPVVFPRCSGLARGVQMIQRHAKDYVTKEPPMPPSRPWPTPVLSRSVPTVKPQPTRPWAVGGDNLCRGESSDRVDCSPADQAVAGATALRASQRHTGPSGRAVLCLYQL